MRRPGAASVRRGLRVTGTGLVLLALVLAAAGAAASPELVTDRPDQTESTETVPVGHVQVELGGAFARDDGGDLRVETLEGPGTLVRIGLLERLELRLGWRGWVSQESRLHETGPSVPEPSQLNESGRGDTELGFKVRLRSPRGPAPRVALLAGLSIPTGEEEFTSDRADPNLRLSFAHALSQRIDLGYNLGARWETETIGGSDRHRTTSFLYTAVLGFALSERLGAFAELFGETDEGSEGETRNSLDAGVTYLARPNLQLDLAAGVGLSEAADDWFVGLGLSVRLPD